MPTRTWLTTPPGQAPSTTERDPVDERYVPGLEPPREPRVPGRHRRLLIVTGLVLAAVVVVATLVLVGQDAQHEDPAAPDAPEPEAPEPPEGELELPET